MSRHVNNVWYDDPRAVAIAEKYAGGDPNDNTPHSAVHGGFNVLTDSRVEIDKLIGAWDEIAQAFAQKVAEILGRATTDPPTTENGNGAKS